MTDLRDSTEEIGESVLIGATTAPFAVVVVDGSAGGFEALTGDLVEVPEADMKSDTLAWPS